MRLRKDDQVVVLTGRDRGKKGKIIKFYPKEEAVLVTGINLIHKHMRRTRENPRGGIIVRETPIQVSKVKLVCPRCNKPAKIAHTILADGTRRRTCKKCKEIL